ncbi:response regulator [Massilia sp. G4R7]|uniref:histidine kinase n=1 Tax=Massilia phyllostachyos TaxID=2898585 RepID=A0ABS8QDE8_9BURK|nr:hybrid sensor histidine kinase/response regulator [Massilia phyllostachyos]MCD2519097.1 response regulator [Massilia phyllostachyos]
MTLASSLRLLIAAPLLALSFFCSSALAGNERPLELTRAARSVDAWQALTILQDPQAALDARGALAASSRFAAPELAAGTLGVQQHPTWIRIPLRTAADAPRDWVLQVDFALLDRFDIWIVENGALRKLASAGRHQDGAGALGGRVPAVALILEPGREYTVLARVFARGPRLAPVAIMQPAAFHHASLAEQMLQGLLFGVAACLILYSLAQSVTLRDTLYAKYAMFIGGLSLYSVCWFGLGEQFLWGGNPWFSKHMMGLSSQLASTGAYLFVEHILARPGKDRRFSRVMRGIAAFEAMVGLAWALDLIDHRLLILIVATLGNAPMLLGLPGAWRKVREGDAIGVYFFLSWACSVLGAVVQTLVIAGKIPATFWTVHSLQFGVTLDMLMFIRMISLRHKATQEAMLRAEAEARMKTEFLANMSHEIRTPMNAIIGMSRLALMGEAPPKTRNYVSKILGAGEHLLGLINDILDHSKMEAGKLTIEQVPFDLNEMLEHLSSVTSVKSDAKGVELIFRVGNRVPQRLVGDPLRLGQVLVNLTGNAVKFTEQGEIVVAVDVVGGPAEDGRLSVEFSVSDTGIGMNEEQIGRLFQSFTQADSSTTRMYGGTGLGLSISRQLVELMEGGIVASSSAGAGSRFAFTVPLGVADADSAPFHRSTLRDMRALVVDDSASARVALAEMLDSLGVRAEIVASGEECLRAMAGAQAVGKPYDVVLMDYLMPGLDGVETIRRIRRAAATGQEDTPPAILMVSVCTRDTVLEQEGELPVDAFLHKPVGPALLYHSLLQALHPQLGLQAADGAAPPALVAMADIPRLDGARILLAEDNANNREVALDFMAAARMQVDVAFNGVEAVRMAKDGDYDLVLMDVQMPGMDGLDAARAILREPRLRALPIVAMTAHALPSDRAMSLDAGMVDHVTKPIDPDLLFCTLLKWIDPARLQGRPLPRVAGEPAPDRSGATAALPAAPGMDWRLALDKVDGQRARLEKRASSFLREYADAPRVLREALGGGDHPRLQSLAHNLKSSAAYVGAFELSAAAHRLEQDLRNGQATHLAAQVPALVTAAENVLAALSQLAEAAHPRPYDPRDLGALLARLQGYLCADDARAEDALAELETLLAGGPPRAELDALRRAVRDVEYAAALAPLARLSAALEAGVERAA